MVPGYGTVAYNGYKIPATYNLKLTSNPVYSDSNRMTLKYLDNTLTCEFIYSQEMVPRPVPPYTMDNEMEVFRTAIMTPRRDLFISFQGSGYGTNGIYIYPNTYFKKYINPFGKVGPYTNDRGRRIGEAQYINEVGGGPLPRIVSWEPIGVNKACKVVWSVDFRTVRYPFSTEQLNEEAGYFSTDHYFFLNFDFDRSFSINEEGISTITTTGYVEIPYRRNWPRNADGYEIDNEDSGLAAENRLDTVLVSADDDKHWNDPVGNINNKRLLMGFLDSCLPTSVGGMEEYDVLKQAEGFVVKRFDRTLDRSGTRLEFIHVVEEHPSSNALFPYTIKVDAKHRIKSSLLEEDPIAGVGFFSWLNTLEANITIAPGYSQVLAYTIFFFLLQQRMQRIGTSRIINPEEDANKTANKGEPRTILLSLEIEENIYGRTHSFRADYTGIYKLDDLLKQSGLFTPVSARRDINGKYPWESGYIAWKKGEWANHVKTVYEVLFHEDKGYRNAHQPLSFVFDPYYANNHCNDGIPRSTQVLVNKAPESEKSPGNTVDNPIYMDTTSTEQISPTSSQKASYIAYHNDFDVIEKTRVYPIAIQDSSDQIDKYKSSSSSELRNNNPITSNLSQFHLYDKYYAEEMPDSAINSIAGGSTFIVTLKGYGIRVNHKVPAPALVAMTNGQKTVPLERIGDPVISTTVIGAGDNPLHITKWQISYSVPFPLTGAIEFEDSETNEMIEGGRLFPIDSTPSTTA